MNLKRIIKKGYLPKELPPPFNSTKFGDKVTYIYKKWEEYQNTLRLKVGDESAKQTYAPEQVHLVRSNYYSTMLVINFL